MLYDRSSSDSGFFRYGLFAPLRDFPITSFVVVIVILALSLSVIVVPRLSSFFARRGFLVGALSAALSIASCLGVYVFAHDVYRDAVGMRGLVRNSLATRQSTRVALSDAAMCRISHITDT
jgi:hypothetical protein